MSKRNVTVLNTTGEVVAIVSWQRAVILMMTDKAYPACDESQNMLIQTVHNTFSLPRVLALARYVNIPFSVATPTKRNVMKRDGYECQYCSKSLDSEDQTIDHVRPRSKGGLHEWKNIVACCKKCNSRKGDRSLEECGMTLRKKPHAPSRSELLERH